MHPRTLRLWKRLLVTHAVIDLKSHPFQNTCNIGNKVNTMESKNVLFNFQIKNTFFTLYIYVPDLVDVLKILYFYTLWKLKTKTKPPICSKKQNHIWVT